MPPGCNEPTRCKKGMILHSMGSSNAAPRVLVGWWPCRLLHRPLTVASSARLPATTSWGSPVSGSLAPHAYLEKSNLHSHTELVKMRERIFIGTAGWSIPAASAHRFAGEGTHLQRYARLLGCTELNSSFQRQHTAVTYAKWAMSTPSHFRFAIKVPRAITHDLRLRRTRLPLEGLLPSRANSCPAARTCIRRGKACSTCTTC